MSDLTSMHWATENFHYPELVEEPLRLELNFTFLLQHVTELIVLGKRMSSIADQMSGIVGKRFWTGQLCSTKVPSLSLYLSIGTLRQSTVIFYISWQLHFLHYQHATQQFAGWALKKDGKLLSWKFFSEFFGNSIHNIQNAVDFLMSQVLSINFLIIESSKMYGQHQDFSNNQNFRKSLKKNKVSVKANDSFLKTIENVASKNALVYCHFVKGILYPIFYHFPLKVLVFNKIILKFRPKTFFLKALLF